MKKQKRRLFRFRPKDDAQARLIRAAQSATGLSMPELIRRAVLTGGLADVVAEAKARQAEAMADFEERIRDLEQRDRVIVPVSFNSLVDLNMGDPLMGPSKYSVTRPVPATGPGTTPAAEGVNTCPRCRSAMRLWALDWRTQTDPDLKRVCLQMAIEFRDGVCSH